MLLVGYRPQRVRTPVAVPEDLACERRRRLLVELAARPVVPDLQQRASWGSCGNGRSGHGFRQAAGDLRLRVNQC